MEVPAYVRGELTEDERARFVEHLRACHTCRSEVADVEALLEWHRRTAPTADSVDLVPAVMERVAWERRAAATVRSPLRRVRSRWRAAWNIAAALLVGLTLLGAAIALFGSGGDRASAKLAGGDPAVARAVAWLEEAQEPSGRWSAVRWGGQDDFDIGLSALSLLAVLHGSDRPAQSLALARGIDYLLAEQAQDGHFGAKFAGAIYNHGIATVALLEAYGVLRTPRLREPIDRAIALLLATQSRTGGWGYARLRDDAGNTNSTDSTAATCWPLQAVLLARALGWDGCDASIEAGLAYLARATDERGRVGYRRAGDFPYGAEGLSSMGAFCVLLAGDASPFPERSRRRLIDALLRVAAMRATGAGRKDLYRDFFVCSGLGALGGEPARRTRERVARVLVTAQLREGPEAGAWPLADRWTAAGGRLYSTALAVLTLESPERGRRLSGWLAQGG